MSADCPGPRRGGRAVALAVALVVSACAAPPPVREAPPPPPPVKVDETAMLPLLAYHQLLTRLTAAELARERIVLAAIPQTPAAHLRQAMLYGQPRGPLDLPRALSLLDGVLKSTDPTAASLHPLARLLADHYGERQKHEMQSEKTNQQLKESQRKTGELQDKLDALTDIERSLPLRPRGGKVLPGAGR